jgi:hypothetical protein
MITGSPVNTLVGGGVRIGDQQTAPMSGYPQTPSVASGSSVGIGASAGIVDGTPMRVATLVVLSIAGLAGLKWAGFKFNVTVGG